MSYRYGEEGAQFEVTEEHLKLIKSVLWEEPTTEFFMQVNLKRPFGNSGFPSITRDMASILGKRYWEDKLTEIEYVEDAHGKEEARAWLSRMLIETSYALECCCQNLNFNPGVYRNSENGKYIRNWERVVREESVMELEYTTVEVHAMAGSYISKAVKESIEVHKRLGAPVFLVFNDTRVLIDKEYSVQQVCEAYDSARAGVDKA